MESFISPDNHFTLWAILITSSAFGIYGEQRNWFGKVSGVLVTIAIVALLAMLRIVPSASDSSIKVPVYDLVFQYITPMAIPLLLFSANIRRIIKESGRLIVLYLFGALGIVLGAIISFFLINLGAEGFKVAGVWIATLVGGSVNFVAAAETLDFSTSSLFTTAIAVDNFAVTFYIFSLFFLPSVKFLGKYFVKYTEDSNDEILEENKEKGETKTDLASITYVLTIAAVITAAGNWLGAFIQEFFKITISLNLLIITFLITVLATVFHKTFQRLENIAFSIGMSLLYVFLAVVGAASNPKDVVAAGPGILIFAILTLLVQFIFLLIVGKVMKFSLKEIAVASCANVSGPTISAPMAASFGMKQMVTPALLVGILGYVIGTFLGVSVGFWLAP
ncbi:MAG: DUF819 family protein [Acidobacteriota bacterium]